MSSSQSVLDLSRRRVAAISFLANISTDDSVTEIRLDCLQNTHVLRDFQRNKRQRQDHFAALHESATPLPPSDAADSLGRKSGQESKISIPRKLTFFRTDQQRFEEQCELEQALQEEYISAEEPLIPRRQVGSVQVDSKDNLLHLDLSKTKSPKQQQQHYPPLLLKSAPLSSAADKSNIIRFASTDKTISSSNEFLASENKSMVSVKRKLTHYSKYDDARPNNDGDSVESLVTGARIRKISGNISDNSSSSLKEFRYCRGTEDDKNIGDERLVFVSSDHKVPFAVSSIISFTKPTTKISSHRRQSLSRLSFRGEREANKHTRNNSGNRPLAAINDTFDPLDIITVERADDGQETSYSHLLNPTPFNAESDPNTLSATTRNRSMKLKCSSSDIRNSTLHLKQDDSFKGAVGTNDYSPHELEGWLIAGKHRTFLPFSSYVTSVIEYVKPSEMKKELNLKFKERFPNLQLSMSKLRSLKREMRRIVLIECSLDMLTVALAYVYFEMLVLKNSISKMNRKFCAAACLILAAKLNDVKGAALKNLIEKTESVFRLNRKDLLASEFAVLVALEFALHVPTWQVFPHYQRLLYEV